MKRLLSLLLTLMITFSMVGAAVSAYADDGVVDVVVYNNSGGVKSGATSNPDTLQALQDWFAEKIGVRLKVITPPAGEETTKLNLMLTGGDQLDAFWGRWDVYEDTGLAQPITKYFSAEKYPAIAKEYEKSLDSMTDSNGELWGIPYGATSASYPFLYRADWAAQIGVTEKPKTIDDVNALLYAIKDADPAGNGQTIPLVARDISNILHAILGLYTKEGYSYWLDESDGKVKTYITQEGAKDAVAQIHQWYADDILYKDFNGTSQADLRELATTNRAFGSLEWKSTISMAWQNMYVADPTTPAYGEYAWLATEDGKTGCNREHTDIRKGLLFSSKASPEVIDAILRMIDFQLGDSEARFNATYGVDAWEYLEGSTQSAQSKDTLQNGGTVNYNAEYRISIGNTRVAEFTEMLGRLDDRYIASNGETAGYFWYFLYMKAYEADCHVPFGYTHVFNETKIAEDLISYTDIQTKIDEDLYKFVVGTRSMDEWDSFIQELYQMGMGEVEDALTEQYKEMI